MTDYPACWAEVRVRDLNATNKQDLDVDQLDSNFNL